ncbi:MAG: hypothetical protein IPP00_08245 [Actinomycetales bacterium]|uniref:Uncharacterized protein n=1 Tax=Candidatus Phosphoribacter hodrii TaxID=2953743 RepID=A0A9D7TAN9_9MICO|nr:hypothetical protein [Candidatus Phosphoribacter hodrii]
MILVDQLDLLGRTMDRVFDAINRADAEALVIHGRFLQEKFGHASTGGELALGSATPLPTMPTTPTMPPAQTPTATSDAHGTDAPCDADARHRHPTSPVATPHRKAGLDEPAA